MFRRVWLAISFVAALGVAGFVVTDSAEARGRHRGHGHGHHGHHHHHHGVYYGGYGGYYPTVIRSSYYPPIYYGAPAYYGGYGGNCHDGGLSFSIGF